MLVKSLNQLSTIVADCYSLIRTQYSCARISKNFTENQVWCMFWSEHLIEFPRVIKLVLCAFCIILNLCSCTIELNISKPDLDSIYCQWYKSPCLWPSHFACKALNLIYWILSNKMRHLSFTTLSLYR